MLQQRHDYLVVAQVLDAVRRAHGMSAAAAPPAPSDHGSMPAEPEVEEAPLPLSEWNAARVERWLASAMGLPDVAAAAAGEVDGSTAIEMDKVCLKALPRLEMPSRNDLRCVLCLSLAFHYLSSSSHCLSSPFHRRPFVLH